MKVLIDGENFRQRLVDVLSAVGAIRRDENFKYDTRGLLSDVLGTDELEINYYASEIKTPVGYEPSSRVKSQITKIRNSQRRWVAQLANQGINYIKAGSLKVKSGKPCWKCKADQEHLQEKGVDVRLSLDIFEESLNKDTKTMAVVSSDTDICPAYHKIRKYGTTVKYVCFAASLNRAVSAATQETITITTEKAVEYLKKLDKKK